MDFSRAPDFKNFIRQKQCDEFKQEENHCAFLSDLMNDMDYLKPVFI